MTDRYRRSLLALALAALVGPAAAQEDAGLAVLGQFDEALQRFDREQLATVLAADARVSVTTCSAPESVKSGVDFIESTVSMAPAIKTYRRTRGEISRGDGADERQVILNSRVHEALEAHAGLSQQGLSSEKTTLNVRGGRLVITAIESKMDCP